MIIQDTDTVKNLRQFLADRNMSQAALGRTLDYTPVYMWRLFSFAVPVTDAFRWRFAQAFGFDVAQQVFGNGVENDDAPA